MPTIMQLHSVKLFGEREVEQPARQGERYIKPSDPHTWREEYLDLRGRTAESYQI